MASVHMVKKMQRVLLQMNKPLFRNQDKDKRQAGSEVLFDFSLCVFLVVIETIPTTEPHEKIKQAVVSLPNRWKTPLDCEIKAERHKLETGKLWGKGGPVNATSSQ